MNNKCQFITVGRVEGGTRDEGQVHQKPNAELHLSGGRRLSTYCIYFFKNIFQDKTFKNMHQYLFILKWQLASIPISFPSNTAVKPAALYQ
jgi:hypothetical protein